MNCPHVLFIYCCYLYRSLLAMIISGMFNEIHFSLKEMVILSSTARLQLVLIFFMKDSQLHHHLKIFMCHPREVVEFFLDGSPGLGINDRSLQNLVSWCSVHAFLLSLRRRSHSKAATLIRDHLATQLLQIFTTRQTILTSLFVFKDSLTRHISGQVVHHILNSFATSNFKDNIISQNP